MRWRAEAYLWHVHGDTTAKQRHEDVSTGRHRRRQQTHLKPLPDLLHEHVPISREAIDCQHGLVRPAERIRQLLWRNQRKYGDVQSEDLGRIARLDAVALALASVPGDDSEIFAGDGKDGAAVVAVRIELSLLGVNDG